MRSDLFHSIRPIRAISPDEGAANDNPVVSQIIDTLGFDSLLFIIATGAVLDAGATFTVLVEHGDDPALGDAAAVPDAQLHGTEAAASFTEANDNAMFKIGYHGQRRYVRLTITPAGNAAAWDHCVVALLGHPNDAPVPVP